MSEDKTKTVNATFSTREAADRAVEHLVQQYGLNRADVFVEAMGSDNSAGTEESGGDAPSAIGDDERHDGALAGSIRVSVDVAEDDVAKVRKAFADTDAEIADVG